MKNAEAIKVIESNQEAVVDLGDATEKTLGNTRAGVHETLGPRRYRT